jgi:hypothetical protein
LTIFATPVDLYSLTPQGWQSTAETWLEWYTTQVITVNQAVYDESFGD